MYVCIIYGYIYAYIYPSLVGIVYKKYREIFIYISIFRYLSIYLLYTMPTKVGYMHT